MYLENNKIKNFVKSEIVCKLEDFSIDNNYEYIQIYACQLAFKLFKKNVDGFFYDTVKAKKWISEHFNDLSEIVEKIQTQYFDEDFCNKIMLDFFKNPDCFIVVIVLEVASYLLGQCKYIDENWNDKITLTNDVIDTICQQLDEL